MTGGRRPCDDEAPGVYWSSLEVIIGWSASCLQMPLGSSISPAEAIVLSTIVVVLRECWRWRIIRERQELMRMFAFCLDLRDLIDVMDFIGRMPQATAPLLGGKWSG